MSVQTGLSREVDCLKDQLDVMREAWHNLSDTSGRYEWEEPEPGSDAHAQSNARAQRLPSLRSEACLLKLQAPLMQRSEACLAGPESSQSQSNLLEHSYTVSRTNLAKVKHKKIADCYEMKMKALYYLLVSSSSVVL